MTDPTTEQPPVVKAEALQPKVAELPKATVKLAGEKNPPTFAEGDKDAAINVGMEYTIYVPSLEAQKAGFTPYRLDKDNNKVDATKELLTQFPLLKLITGDAIYAQRPLAEALLDENCDYLVQIKGNQPDIQDALKHCLGSAHERQPAAQTAEKKGTSWIGGGCGLI